MPFDVMTVREQRLIEEYDLRTPEAALAELDRRGLPHLLEARSDLQYRYHTINGHGWVCWSNGRGYVAQSKLGAMLELLEALR